MHGRRLIILILFGILGVLGLEGLMAHTTGTVVAKIEHDRQAWQQTADACVAVIIATGAPPRAWEDFPPPAAEGIAWREVRQRVRIDFRPLLQDLRTSPEAVATWITMIRDGPPDLTEDRRRLAATLAAVPTRP